VVASPAVTPALDVIDIATETLFGQIGGNGMGQANFKGDTGSTATSGPDGVVAAFPCIFAGDGDSRLLSFKIPSGTQVSAQFCSVRAGVGVDADPRCTGRLR